jgi:hypothetical protein
MQIVFQNSDSTFKLVDEPVPVFVSGVSAMRTTSLFSGL